MRTSDKSFPETVEELVAECDALSNRYDLYALEQTEPDELTERLDFEPNCPPAGEFLYGCAMIPAQWVLHVLGEPKEGKRPSPLPRRRRGGGRMSDRTTTCPWCGIPIEKGTATDGEKDYWIVECPECGCFKVLGELKEEDE